MYYQNESDETLVMLTLTGEQAAYEVLVKRYQKMVISSAIMVTRNRFMAEDAAQDAFVTAWMKLNTLQDPKKYISWVRRIAKNCALSMVSRYRSFLPLEVVENLRVGEAETEDPTELCVMAEERNEVSKSIDTLSDKVRQIIFLHYFEDMPIAEIADRMRISGGLSWFGAKVYFTYPMAPSSQSTTPGNWSIALKTCTIPSPRPAVGNGLIPFATKNASKSTLSA